jgi:hypothetical protein
MRSGPYTRVLHGARRTGADDAHRNRRGRISSGP